MRLKNPLFPSGGIIEVLVPADTVAKLKKLVALKKGKILEMEDHQDHVRMVIQK